VVVTNKKKFNFPNNLLKQLDECSFGGYILFNFNSKGDPQVFTKFDNQMNAMALLYYLGSWSSTVDQMNMDATADAIMEQSDKNNKNNNDFDSEDDEEDTEE
jgi:hypothetical protein